ncbi:hypothetical protein BC834DRAFT_847306 [Gloeopeniophorella convolvens]|nr:hypothetical protein BC834DRAFT_847306 [Gloeopeniophorella convolvens]
MSASSSHVAIPTTAPVPHLAEWQRAMFIITTKLMDIKVCYEATSSRTPNNVATYHAYLIKSLEKELLDSCQLISHILPPTQGQPVHVAATLVSSWVEIHKMHDCKRVIDYQNIEVDNIYAKILFPGWNLIALGSAYHAYLPPEWETEYEMVECSYGVNPMSLYGLDSADQIFKAISEGSLGMPTPPPDTDTEQIVERSLRQRAGTLMVDSPDTRLHHI